MGGEDSREENTSGYCTNDPFNYDEFIWCKVCQHAYRRGGTFSYTCYSDGSYSCGDCDRREQERQRQNKRDRIRIEIERYEAQQVLPTQKLNAKETAYEAIRAKLRNIHSQIEEEEEKVENFKYPEKESNKIVVIIGNTGDGKSTFCNRLSGDTSKYGNQGPFGVSGGSAACTQSVRYTKVNTHGVDIGILDTPGFNDGAGNDRFHANNICKYLKGCGGINAFVLIRNSTNCRFDSAFQRLLKQYADIFGAQCFFSNLVVIATRVDFNNEQFVENKQAESLKNNIIELAQQKHDIRDLDPSIIEVIPIGLDNHQKPVCEFARCISSKAKFECDAIKSPLSVLRETEQELSAEMDVIEEECNRLRCEIADKRKKIAELKSSL